MHASNRFLLCFTLMVGGLFGPSAIAERPYWIKHLPKAPRRANFYYRVTVADGRDYESAYARAFQMAMQESAAKVGIAVDIAGKPNHSVTDIYSDAQNTHVMIPINLVCSYQENVTENNNIRLFTLWQVTRDVNRAPGFKDFNRCD